ncbi:hypothetical protein FQN54_009071 [Arachnomyces sp. PD_36]|nr:hypothetical protein FQN54_009071 [Arachnomyces sp. PD_36]
MIVSAKLCVVLGLGAAAQLFSDGSGFNANYPGISDDCKEALNRTVACDSFLADGPDNYVQLSTEELDKICVPDCPDALEEFRSHAEEKCSAESDIIVIDDIAYPATYTVEKLLYNYNVTCDEEEETNDYCWIVVGSMNGTEEELCSDCFLGRYQMDLSSPFGYNDRLEKEFSSLTSSCSETGYPWTSPTPIAINETAPPTPTPITCDKSQQYTIQEGDDCKSISVAQNVSSWALTQENELQAYCKNFPGPDTTICLPTSCSIYTLKEGDTCDKIIESHSSGFTLTQLRSWNPNINKSCGNLFQWTGFQICVSPPGSELDPPAPTITPTPNKSCTGLWQPSSCYTPVPTSDVWPIDDAPPKPLAKGTLNNCTVYAEYQNTTKPEYDNSCNTLAYFYGVTMGEIQEWNPSLSSNATDCAILPGYRYCVVNGDTSTPTTTGNSSTPTPTPTPTGDPTTTVPSTTGSTTTVPTGSPTPSPVQEGIAEDCGEYYFVEKDDGCQDIADEYEISLDDFYKWNPAVEDDCSKLFPDYYVCVGVSD